MVSSIQAPGCEFQQPFLTSEWRGPKGGGAFSLTQEAQHFRDEISKMGKQSPPNHERLSCTLLPHRRTFGPRLAILLIHSSFIEFLLCVQQGARENWEQDRHSSYPLAWGLQASKGGTVNSQTKGVGVSSE